MEHSEAAEDRRAGNHEAKMLLGSRIQPGAGVSQSQGWRHILLQSRPGGCHTCPGAGLGRETWKGMQRKGRSAMMCAEWRLEQGRFWIREGSSFRDRAGKGVDAQSTSRDRGASKSKLEG